MEPIIASFFGSICAILMTRFLMTIQIRKREEFIANSIDLIETIRRHVEHQELAEAKGKLNSLITNLRLTYARPLRRIRRKKTVPRKTENGNRKSG